ncbi:MAG: NAD(P)/FAD-dependent oxidoreductase [Methylohalobius sp. ZOD2]
MTTTNPHHSIVIIGGGAAGAGMAHRVVEQLKCTDVAVIEPSEVHYYQPMWTLVGAGIVNRKTTARNMADLLPRQANWIKERVASVDPDQKVVTTEGGNKIGYDWLIVAAGLKLDWERVDGLSKEIVGQHGICSNYSYDTVDYTWEMLRNFTGGTALFTMPPMPIKCPGAPQKIAYLAEDYFRRKGIRDRCTVHYLTSTPGIFGVKKYADALTNLVLKPRDIQTSYRHNLVAIRPEAREAVFENLDSGETVVHQYDMIHVTPPQSPPDFVKNSPLANEAGWVDVDQYTMRHVRYPNVFALGDCAGSPNSKTAAAVRSQAPVVVRNLAAAMGGGDLKAQYDGYGSCPLVTRYGRVILAEFLYGGEVRETFPFDQGKERLSMYLLKRYVLPLVYWKGLVKGRQWPKPVPRDFGSGHDPL